MAFCESAGEDNGLPGCPRTFEKPLVDSTPSLKELPLTSCDTRERRCGHFVYGRAL